MCCKVQIIITEKQTYNQTSKCNVQVDIISILGLILHPTF